MVQYDRKIINQLLDTYENSLLSTGENKRTIQIEFRFTKTLIPAYFDESSSEYENIHISMKELESKKLILIKWKENKQMELYEGRARGRRNAGCGRTPCGGCAAR